ncbi:MAG: energy transducer TonB [Pseudomonadales bacterium]|nr:energy transducer TonB [Pseudomonadales bacterium]
MHFMPPLRMPGAMLGAATVTTALFYLMLSLLADLEVPDEIVPTINVDWVKVTELEPPAIRERRIQRPVDPAEVPDPPKPTTTLASETVVPYGEQVITKPKGPDEINLAPTDGEAVVIVRVQPSYPSTAAQRGIEGYVVVAYDIDEKGQAFNARVVENFPSGIFDKAALKALGRFRFKPQIVNGKATTAYGMHYRFTFELAKG